MLEKNVETHKEFLNRDPLFKAGFLYASIIVSIVWIVAFAFWTRTLNKQEKIVDIKAKDIKANKIEFNNTLAIHPEWSRGYKEGYSRCWTDFDIEGARKKIPEHFKQAWEKGVDYPLHFRR